MFHQIKVKQDEIDSLHFVWRENPDMKLDEYTMTVHIFGKVDSPCIANWSLKQCASENDPEIRNLFRNNFYMDDFLFSTNCQERLLELSKRLRDSI